MVRREMMENEAVPIPSDEDNNIKSISEHSEVELKAMGYDLVAEIEEAMALIEQKRNALRTINEELSARIKK